MEGGRKKNGDMYVPYLVSLKWFIEKKLKKGRGGGGGGGGGVVLMCFRF